MTAVKADVPPPPPPILLRYICTPVPLRFSWAVVAVPWRRSFHKRKGYPTVLGAVQFWSFCGDVISFKLQGLGISKSCLSETFFSGDFEGEKSIKNSKSNSRGLVIIIISPQSVEKSESALRLLSGCFLQILLWKCLTILRALAARVWHEWADECAHQWAREWDHEGAHESTHKGAKRGWLFSVVQPCRLQGLSTPGPFRCRTPKKVQKKQPKRAWSPSVPKECAPKSEKSLKLRKSWPPRTPETSKNSKSLESDSKVALGLLSGLLWGRPQKPLFSHFRVTLNFSRFRGFWEVMIFLSLQAQLRFSKFRHGGGGGGFWIWRLYTERRWVVGRGGEGQHSSIIMCVASPAEIAASGPGAKSPSNVGRVYSMAENFRQVMLAACSPPCGAATFQEVPPSNGFHTGSGTLLSLSLKWPSVAIKNSLEHRALQRDFQPQALRSSWF